MKIKLYDKVLFRVPQFPVDATLEECWSELKESIKDASSDFYDIIKDLEYSQIEGQPQNIKNTISKYFNRSKYRATPYGTFASIGTARLDKCEQSRLTITSKPIIKSFADWKNIRSYQDYWKECDVEKLLFQSNTTYYKCNDSIRYVYNADGKFELSEVPYHAEVLEVLKACKEAKRLEKIAVVPILRELDNEVLKDLIKDLVDLQLLFTDKHPNIIGTDYFKRIDQKISSDTTYNISLRQTVESRMSHSRFIIVEEAISFLHEIYDQPAEETTLDNFKQRFIKKYDQRAVPVMEALDPIIGISYGYHENFDEKDSLIHELRNARTAISEKGKSSLQHEIRSLVNNENLPETILLDKLKATNLLTAKLPLPNTVNALVKVIDEKIQVNYLGGATATSLLGRFTIADQGVNEICKDLVRIEEQANPDIVFFDIAYAGEREIDNVNRRLNVYDDTLAISSFVEENAIDISDVYLMMDRAELILFSKSMNKRLVPRLASAYNYTRADLPLFRLLCDLQHQGIVSNLLPNWKELFSGHEFIPRLQYKNAILGLRSWLLRYDSTFENASEFSSYLKDINIGRCIQIGTGDQTIRIDTADDGDRTLLMSILKVRPKLWAEEYLEPKMPIIVDESDSHYTSEFALTYYHDSCIYAPMIDRPEFPVQQRFFPPGSEWLYFEIYAHDKILEDLLKDNIPRLLHATKEHIEKWFFIRYNEGGEHLRLRFKQLNPEANQLLIQEVLHFLAEQMNMAIIRDFKICTYTRELERYAYADIEAIEHHFYLDTTLVMALIKDGYSTHQLYSLVTTYIMDIGIAHFGVEKFSIVLKDVKSGYANEHGLTTQHFKHINQSFEKCRRDIPPTILPDSTTQLVNAFSKSLRSRLQCVGALYDSVLFTDLLHMHINRLFACDQRIHELIIYEYMYKMCKRK